MACYIYKGNTYTKEELLAIKNQIIAENEAVFNQRGSEALNDINVLVDQLVKGGLAEEVIVGNTQTLLDVLDEAGVSEDLRQQVVAWHGSPYSFDRFTTEKMGTGEGVQAFGWGLYFTDLESIAKNYADKLGAEKITFEGVDINDTKGWNEAKEALSTLGGLFDGFGFFRSITTIEKLANKVKTEYLPYLASEKINDIDKIQFQEYVDAADYLLNNIDKFKVEKGKNLYKVSLHKGKTPDQYTWLEWDKAVNISTIDKIINRQKEKVNFFEKRQKEFPNSFNEINIKQSRRKIEFLNEIKTSIDNGDKYTGQLLVENLSKEFDSQDASLSLLDAGIDGVKFPAESIATGATSETARGFNYVVFDENAITIEEQVKFQKALQEQGIKMIPTGFVKGKKVYINSDVATIETPIHEFAHLYNAWLKENKAELYNRGLELVRAELSKGAIDVESFNKSTIAKIESLYNGDKDSVSLKINGVTLELGAEDLESGDRSIYISEISSDEKGQGKATKVLNQLKKYASENNIPLSLRASVSNNISTSKEGALNQEQLVKWYEKNGFNVAEEENTSDTDESAPFMVYYGEEASPIQSVIDYVKSTQPNLQGEALQEEILTQLTGKKGLELLQSKKKGGIINWIKEALAEIANMLGLSNYSVEKAMNMTIDEFAKAIAVDLLQGENFTGKDGKANFEKWKGNNKLVEGSGIQDVKTGEPIVAKGYHGTTNEFYEFDASVKGNIEGHLGKVNYFTSDYQDASTNYLSEGADITGRISRESERLEDYLYDEYGIVARQSPPVKITDEDYQKISEEFNISVKELKEQKTSQLYKFIPEKQLKGNEEQVLDLYVKLNNPVVLGNGSTWFETLNVSDSDLEQAAQEIADENDITLEEAKDDYNFDIEQRAIENTGYENLHVEALRDALQSNGYDGGLASDILGDNYYETDVDLNKLEQDLRKSELYDNAEGEMASSQVIADFFKNLGFDGIILTDVSERFKNMGLGSGTSHIHVFDEFNTQIKLADGSNVTFGETPDIRFQKQAGITKAEAIKRNNGNPLNLAPNGKSSILYQSYKDLGYFDSEAERLTAQTFSDEFKAWFGDWQNDAENASKVMDENGQPKLMYHETAADWFIYDKTKIEAGKLDSVTPTGIFLKSSNKNIGLGNRQMNLFSSIKNPIYAKDRKELENFFSLNIKGYSEIKEKSSQVEKEYDKILEKEGPRLKEAFKKEIEDFKGELTSEDRIKLVEKVYKNSDTELNDLEVEFENLAIEAKALIDSFMKDSNYDGIFLTSDVGSKGRETDATIAMNPEQIKSATGNIGTFSPTNADIRFQTIPTEETTTIPDCV
jgi:hypothetical protein